MSVVPSGAVNLNAASCPTARAVGYYLPPLRGSRSPRALSYGPSANGPALRNRSLSLLSGIVADCRTLRADSKVMTED